MSFSFFLPLSGFCFSWCCHTCHFKTFLYEISCKWLFFSQWIHASRTPYYASSQMPPGSTTKTKPFQSTTPYSTDYRVPKQTNFLQHSKWAASVCEFTVPSHGWSTVLVSTAPFPVTWEENLLWNLVPVPMIT